MNEWKVNWNHSSTGDDTWTTTRIFRSNQTNENPKTLNPKPSQSESTAETWRLLVEEDDSPNSRRLSLSPLL